MVQIPQTYPPIQSDSVTSFSFTDALTGNGYIILFGGLLLNEATTYESYIAGDDSDYTIDSTNWAAQLFTVGNTGSNTAFFPTRVRLKSGNMDGDTMDIQIQEVTAGEPNGTIIVKFDGVVNKTEEGGGDDWFELDITDIQRFSGVQLQAGTQYALVAFSSAVTDTVRYDNGDGSYSGGVMLTTPDSGSNWTTQTGDDMLFEIMGSTRSPYTLQTETFTTIKTITALEDESVTTNLDTESVSLAFEGELRKSATIKGTALIHADVTTASADEFRPSVEIVHVRGATETTIGTAVGTIDDSSLECSMELTQTSIVPNDRIRLKLIMGTINAAGTMTATFKHDPASSDLTLKLPFRTD